MLAYVGTTEIALVIGAIVVLFGSKKLPELGRSLGEGLREFKKSTRAVVEDEEEEKEKKPAEQS